MGNNTNLLQLFGFSICVFAAVLNVYITAFPEWRRNDPQGDIIEMISRTQGLWMACVRYSTGHFACDEFDRFFLSLDGVIIGARVLCLLSAVMSLVAFFLVVCSAGCTNLMPPSNKKQRIFQSGGVLFLLAAVCTLIAVSWYFATVLDQYYVFGAIGNQGSGSFSGSLGFGDRFVAGYCIYLGWVSSIGGIVGAVVMCYSGRASNNREENYEEEYNETATGYQPYNSPNVNRTKIPTNRTTNPTFIDKDGLYPIPLGAGPGHYNQETRMEIRHEVGTNTREPQMRPSNQVRRPNHAGYTNKSYI